jgi:hypothetical protein
MVEPEVEAAWRAELKRMSETQLGDARRNGAALSDDPMEHAALGWLGDESEARRLRDEQSHYYLRWIFLALVAVVIVGLIGVGLSFLQ